MKGEHFFTFNDRKVTYLQTSPKNRLYLSGNSTAILLNRKTKEDLSLKIKAYRPSLKLILYALQFYIRFICPIT